MDRSYRNLHISALDGVRGLAIFLVFAIHYGGGRRFDSPWLRAYGEIIAGGWIGVDLFFVLSGFLITGILLDSIDDPHYYKTFYARRTLRIFPAYYGALLAVVCLTPVLEIAWKSEHLSFFTYTNNIALIFFPTVAVISPLISFGAFWSLAVEEQFYLIWPFLVRFAKGNRIYYLIGGCILLAFGTRLLCWYFGSILGAFNLMFARMDCLAVGALLAVWIRRTDILYSSLKIPYAILGVSFAAFLLIGLYDHTLYVEAWPMLTIGLTVVAFGCGAVVWLALRQETLVSRVCLIAPLRALGKYSYGLYVYHLLFKGVLYAYLFPALVQLSGSTARAAPLYFVMAFAWNVIFAVASYHWFELPFLRLKKHFPYGAGFTEGKDKTISSFSGR